MLCRLPCLLATVVSLSSLPMATPRESEKPLWKSVGPLTTNPQPDQPDVAQSPLVSVALQQQVVRATVLMGGLVYVAFQKKLLSKPVSRVVAKV